MGSRLDELNNNFEKKAQEKKLRTPSKIQIYVTLIGALILAIIVGIIINPGFFGIDGKDESSPTLVRNEITFTKDIGRPPTHGDLITFDRENAIDGYLIKRIVGLPGDKIDIDDQGKVYVNDQQYQTDKAYFKKDVSMPLTVPENNVFVLGDNGDESADSRNSYIGFVEISTILGTQL